MTRTATSLPVIIICQGCRRMLQGKRWLNPDRIPWYAERVPGVLCPDCTEGGWRERRRRV